MNKYEYTSLISFFTALYFLPTVRMYCTHQHSAYMTIESSTAFLFFCFSNMSFIYLMRALELRNYPPIVSISISYVFFYIFIYYHIFQVECWDARDVHINGQTMFTLLMLVCPMTLSLMVKSLTDNLLRFFPDRLIA